MSEGTSRAEAATHILARETGRRMRAVQARIDEVEEQRKAALDAISSRLTEHDGSEARQDGLIDGLRADLGTVQAVTSAIDAAHGETRELTAAQAQELVRIAQRLTANEAVDARQDGTLAEVLDRVDVLEATAPVPGPKGDRGERGERGPAGPRGAMGPPGIPGSGGSGSGSGGSGAINSVTASSGLSVTGTSDLTITNTGVRSLTGSGLTVSASTGDVTLTAPTVTGGTGISVSGSGTTSITVSATGVNSVTGGTGISVSGTTALTVSATGVQSLTAGNGISVSGTTTPTVSASLAAGSGIGISGTTTLTVSNSGVTSIVAGTNVSVSGATGAVTVNAPAFAMPGSSAVGDSAAAGTATTAARSDHVHGREAFGTPGASAVADTASAGTATTVARSDHRHSREAFGTPVAVTGGATAASGSATTLARSDHVHSTASMPVLLASTTLASDAASISISSIPQTYQSLEMRFTLKSTVTGGATEEGYLRFNGDSTSNYVGAYGNGATLSTAVLLKFISTASVSASASFSTGSVIIQNYTNTSGSIRKAVLGTVTYNTNTTNNEISPWFTNGQWLSSSAITSLAVSMSSAFNVKAGSSIQLYGYP